MAKTNIRADIPIKSPDGMIKLCEAVTLKHETYTDPATPSPLAGQDMAAFKTKTTGAKALLLSADEKHGSGESATLQAWTSLGFAEGQTIRTPGTLYFKVDVHRGLLLAEHKGDEEQLEKYGFNVVIGSARGKATVRVELPVGKPDDFIKLCEAITKQHEALGSGSPLSGEDMATFKTQTIAAKAKLAEARGLHKEAEGDTQRAYTKIGIYKDQTIRTPGTLYFLLDVFRGILLKKFKGDEEQLEQWGFNIVITETLVNKPDKRVTIVIVKSGFITVENVKNGSTANNIGVTDLQWCASEELCTPENANPLAPDQEATIVTGAGPYGTVTIMNLSAAKAGRIRMTVKK